MKFCYLDETGIGQNTCFVLVGIHVDAIRMHRTKQEWDQLIESVNEDTGLSITEIKSSRLIPNAKKWRTGEAESKLEIIDRILDWFSTRKHEVTFAAIDVKRFGSLPEEDIRKIALVSPEIAAAFHIVLTLQKMNQNVPKNKGHTILVFDRGKEPPQLKNLIADPPGWSSSYYTTGQKNRKKATSSGLDQIVDVPYYAESHRVALIQFADLVCHILRRHAELVDYGEQPKSDEEHAVYRRWVEKIHEMCIASSHRYKKKGACDTSRFFSRLAPESLTAV